MDLQELFKIDLLEEDRKYDLFCFSFVLFERKDQNDETRRIYTVKSDRARSVEHVARNRAGQYNFF